MVFISVILWPLVLLMGETGVPGEKAGPVRIRCVTCDQCCQFLCVVHSSLSLWISVTFIYVRCNLKKKTMKPLDINFQINVMLSYIPSTNIKHYAKISLLDLNTNMMLDSVLSFHFLPLCFA